MAKRGGRGENVVFKGLGEEEEMTNFDFHLLLFINKSMEELICNKILPKDPYKIHSSNYNIY